ncbi:LLM class flavin-dependent oxidoreductase [Azohydromonas lata]|uniref:LLM class flavin-dependent oxidoreductase n=1 Tax=Azohydromonas lata TaxID=45677 RepID=A0ABU5ILN2_9BURK|nr:LLM class flavin-dependent oxidoreductase [Azohydromonas lata]MDZ5459806.1 LLM class flavin-dependent oxidoreductase [Azohydromonas lata]
MIPFSVLDLSPIVEGGDAAQSFRHTVELARHCERLGFKRYWLAEHHGMPGIASAATAVLLGHVAGATRSIRVGAGGVMLPNHSPLVIAEQFGTLATLYPGRIDLGVGRAPGSDAATARALRRARGAEAADQFPQDVAELLAYFEPARAGQALRAIPGEGLRVPVWVLGSSLFGAQLAALLGLPYAFASHFAPQQLMPAVELYRSEFRPSRHLDAPYVMLGFNVFAADSDEEGALLASSMQQAFASLYAGRPGRLPPPVAGFMDRLPMAERVFVERSLACSAVGSPATVRRALEDFIARTGADELMLTSQVFDHAARLRSYGIAAEVAGMAPAAA